jgi:hypothetical protein
MSLYLIILVLLDVLVTIGLWITLWRFSQHFIQVFSFEVVRSELEDESENV